MEIREITFNANNWVDGIVSLKYRELKDGTIKFAYRGEKWVMSPIITSQSLEGFSSEYDLFSVMVYQENKTVTEFPTVKMMKFRKDTYWTATDDDYTNGINIEHESRIVAACQILGNII